MQNVTGSPKHLEFGGCDTVELAHQFGTPLYVYDEAAIRNTCQSYVKAFRRHYPKPARVAYAAKAFLTTAMCRIVEQEGLSLDVASAGELSTAINAGFPMDKVYVHGSYKSEADLKMAFTARVHRFVVDSMAELQVLSEQAAACGQVADITLRITPGIEAHTHDYIQTGDLKTKFGLPIAEGLAMQAAKYALSLPALRLHGVHYHIGSQILDLLPYKLAAEMAFNYLADLRDQTGIECAELNIGGGLGIRYLHGDVTPSIESYVCAISENIQQLASKLSYPLPTLIVEPGRSIIGEAGITLYQIGVVKQMVGGKKYLIVDGGLSDNLRPALYGAKYQCLVANKAAVEPVSLFTVAGKHCENDFLFHDILTAPASPGDILAVFSTGAYHYSMSSNYNRYPRPAVVLVNKGEANVIVKRQTLDDLLAGDRIPAYLSK